MNVFADTPSINECVCRYTGNERESPARYLTLNSYSDPVTFIGSDGSEIGDSLQSTFRSIIVAGDTKLSRNLSQDIISNSTGQLNLCSLLDFIRHLFDK